MSKKRIKAICVYCGSRMGISNEYSYNAKLLGQKIAIIILGLFMGEEILV